MRDYKKLAEETDAYLEEFFLKKAEAYAEEYNSRVAPEYHVKYVGPQQIKSISTQEIAALYSSCYEIENVEAKTDETKKDGRDEIFFDSLCAPKANEGVVISNKPKYKQKEIKTFLGKDDVIPLIAA